MDTTPTDEQRDVSDPRSRARAFWDRVLPISERSDALRLVIGASLVLAVTAALPASAASRLVAPDAARWMFFMVFGALRFVLATVVTFVVLRYVRAPRPVILLAVAFQVLWELSSLSTSVVAMGSMDLGTGLSLGVPLVDQAWYAGTNLLSLAGGMLVGMAVYTFVSQGNALARLRSLGFEETTDGSDEPTASRSLSALLLGSESGRATLAFRTTVWMMAAALAAELVSLIGTAVMQTMYARATEGSGWVDPGTGVFAWLPSVFGLASIVAGAAVCYYAVRTFDAPRAVWLNPCVSVATPIATALVSSASLVSQDPFYALIFLAQALLPVVFMPLVLAPGAVAVYLATRDEAATMNAPGAGEALAE